MKKLFLAIAVSLLVGLTACNVEKTENGQGSTAKTTPESTIASASTTPASPIATKATSATKNVDTKKNEFYIGPWVKPADYTSIDRDKCSITSLKYNGAEIKANSNVNVEYDGVVEFTGNDFLKNKKVTISISKEYDNMGGEAEVSDEQVKEYEKNTRYLVLQLDDNAKGSFKIPNDIAKNVGMQCGVDVEYSSPNGGVGIASITDGGFKITVK